MRVPRHCGAVRAERAPRRVGLPLQQRWHRPVHRRLGEGGRRRSRADTSALESPGSITTRTAGSICTWRTTRTANFLYLNQKDGTFKDVGFPQGVAVSEDGAEQGSMGVAVGDYDNCGRFALFVTNFSEEYNNLFHNEGDHFTEMAFRSKTGAVSLPYVGLGQCVLRLRQRRPARHDRRQRARLPADGQGTTRRLRRLPPAQG